MSAAAAAKVPPTDFKSFYSDPDNNPSGKTATELEKAYEEIYLRWRVTNNAPDASEVEEDIATDFDEAIGVVVMFVQDANHKGGVLRLSHGYKKHGGSRSSPSRGKLFGYLDDVVGIDIQSFATDESDFGVTNKVVIPNTPERHLEMLSDEPTAELLPALKDTEAGTKVAMTRRAMFMPFEIAPLYMGKVVTSRQFVDTLIPALDSRGLTRVCKPLIEYAQINNMDANGNGVTETLIKACGDPNVAVTPDVINDRRNKVLYRLLPALKPEAAPKGDPQMRALVGHMATMNDEARKDREARTQAREDSKKPKTNDDAWDEDTVKLLRLLCNGTTNDEIAPIWHKLAARKKGTSKRQLLQKQLDVAANKLKKRKSRASTALVFSLDNWEFASEFKEQLGSAVSPFTIIPPGTTSDRSRKALVEESSRGSQYDILTDNDSGTMSAADAKKLLNKAGFIPTSWKEADKMIECFGPQLASVIGEENRARDIRKDANNKTDFRLCRQLRSYKKKDPPPSRVKPVPITLILYILRVAHDVVRLSPARIIADIICIAFFFLLHPGEYTGTTADDHPFLIEDVLLHLGTRQLDYETSTELELEAATSVSYTFTKQKNGVRGEIITHARSRHHQCCPVLATIRIMLYHRRMKTPKTAPLASYYRKGRRIAVKAKDITDELKAAATIHQAQTGLSSSEITARSLRAGGAMALLCGKVDWDLIRMLGRWHSDAMMRYLFLQAQPVMQNFAAAMYNNGNYTFLPYETVPIREDNE